MNKKIIITALLALVTMTGQAIDDYQFHSGTAVLKGRILNKPVGEWDVISVRAHNVFSDKEIIQNIPVAADGTFEGTISLPHSQSTLALELADVFLAVGDTVEVTKDAALDDYEGVTFRGNSTSADINRLWPEVRKHYFGDGKLFVNGLAKEDIPKWKQDMVKLMDKIIADIEADHLPLPAGSSTYVKEVMGASLLGELLMAFMENYRYNMTSQFNSFYVTNVSTAKLDEYYDFLAERERWLLDNPAMLFVTKDPSILFKYVMVYIMPDIAFMRNSKRPSLLYPISDYYRDASQAITSRYGLKGGNFMQQMMLCLDVFEEGRIDDESEPDDVAANFAGAIPLLTNPIVARHALNLYRQYVINREGKGVRTASATPEADAVFQRIIDAYKGNALYIDFWDMSCAPCRRSMLDEREKVDRMKDEPVRFLYICDEKTSPRERAEKWLQENSIKGEHIYVSHNDWLLLGEKFQFNAVPFSLAIDKYGNFVTHDYLNRYFNELIKTED